MDVATMPAGPALDRLVAERVLGRPYRDPSGWEMQYEGAARDAFSTDIAHAWAVVEHLRAAGVKWEIADDYLDAGAGSWFAMTEQTKAGAACRVVGPYAETVPLAICRAALLALEA